MNRIVRLVPFFFFRLGLFSLWRLVPRSVRKAIVGRVVPPLPRRQRRLSRPVNPVLLIGQLRSTTGFGWVARLQAELAREAELDVYGADVAAAFAADHLEKTNIVSAPPNVCAGPATMLLFLNPDQFRYAVSFLPPGTFENKYVIGHCAWELERIPESWLEPLTLLDEVWVPSEFSRQAFLAGGVTIPCRVVPHFLAVPPSLRPNRRRFAIDPTAFAVLIAFSLRSGLERKNPLAAVRAFLMAFPNDPGVQLVLKVSDIDVETAAWARLRETVGDDPRIIFVTEMLSDFEMWTLITSVDVVLSTHRAEGFGIIPAQAMLCGRVAVATGWSGNLDYMDSDTAALLPYTLSPVHDPTGHYTLKDMRWAEVDEYATAGALERLREDPSWRQALAKRGKARIEAQFTEHRTALVASMRIWAQGAPAMVSGDESENTA